MRVAAAPISWGVCEVPGWGFQLAPSKVLDDCAAIGLNAIEAGPPGFLPANPMKAAGLLSAHGLRLVGGFLAVVLHEDVSRASAEVERQARWLQGAGGEVLILAAATGRAGYEAAVELDTAAWGTLFDSLMLAGEIAAAHHLMLTLHPHVGTVIERREQVDRFLDGCATRLCLDTGHLAVAGMDPAEIAELATARVHHVHLKDVDADLAAQVRSGRLAYAEAVKRGLYRLLGEGQASIAGVLRCLQSAGYEGWYVLEQDVALDGEPADAGPVAAVGQSLEFVISHA